MLLVKSICSITECACIVPVLVISYWILFFVFFFVAQLNKQKESSLNQRELAMETEQLGRELINGPIK